MLIEDDGPVRDDAVGQVRGQRGIDRIHWKHDRACRAQERHAADRHVADPAVGPGRHVKRGVSAVQ